MPKNSKKKRRAPQSPRVTAVRTVGIAAFFLPCALYFICTMVIFPVPANVFTILGLLAALLLGIPCMLLVGSVEPEAFGAGKAAAARVSLLLGLPPAAILVCACMFLYLPALHNADFEEAMSVLLLNIGILLLTLLIYVLFRQSAKACLRAKGLSKSSIRKILQESRRKMLFQPFRKELGVLYILNFCLLILFAIILFLMLPAMLWGLAEMILTWLQAISMILLAVMLLISGVYSKFQLLSERNKSGLGAYLILCAFLCYLAGKLISNI